ncbi:MAG: shikimate kinase [Candidatus Methanofastidiosum methylothiophilum]|uniref:shikimate kinase n=1 Tax=Candidatus Methanofastidiosum methylothiophilum TaxID=1705564 RepID=A0A150JJP3_9EURY|nr:MAG: shikimate kinase [Candidatus Methanofastidiosum methylthiophilus]MBP6932616.1 shikimate kinase [Methanofastidiosum sp.]KYC57308.1 MAG: shikimate kinase [Candidatus Methanofastidiosum methylthiophilus]KYC57485.1 MAG: shikimate kinase [Candidatus Methanofastidiosum methylthiophilus]HNV94200.1 shikimate kinase [Methanofastidiosum sp.]
MNIVLFGLRCVGKTSVGVSLSDITDKIFFDTDRIIEKRESKTIHEIINEKGWEYFRLKEKETIADVSKENNAVISLGGGALMDRSNVDLLDKSFFVLLRASINTMKTRMEKDVPRPSLTKNDSISEIEEIVLERMPLYEKIADIIIDTDKLSVYEICDKILLELEKRSMV